ncbi:MAG: TolB family protein [Acidobacteriota bacterium]
MYAAEGGGRTQLYLRALDEFQARPIPGTEDASAPFFSPDGQWVGFYANGRLQKVSVTGGGTLTLCDTPVAPYGASWGSDDAIIFDLGGLMSSRLMRVSAAGGTPEALTGPDTEESAVVPRWPQVLPGGKAVLLTVSTDEGSRTAVLSLTTGEWRMVEGLGEARQARYVPTGSGGHLIYARAGGLTAVPFDLARLEPRGSPVSILDAVYQAANSAYFTISRSGSLVYVPGSPESAVVWVDREGRAAPLPMDRGRYFHPRLSPDGGRVAVGANGDIWVHDLARGTRSRLTVEGNSAHPTWTPPDGKRVAFNTNQGLYWKPADGSDEAELLWASEDTQVPMSWSPDGLLAFEERTLSGTQTSGC